VFDFVEEALDEIALTIEHEITIALQLAVGLWPDHWNDCPEISHTPAIGGLLRLRSTESNRFASASASTSFVGASRAHSTD
jgi:hypothetical protein